MFMRGNDRVDEEEIERQVDELRVKLLDEMKRGAGGVNARGLKPHQVHELAAAKLGMSPPVREIFFPNCCGDADWWWV